MCQITPFSRRYNKSGDVKIQREFIWCKQGLVLTKWNSGRTRRKMTIMTTAFRNNFTRISRFTAINIYIFVIPKHWWVISHWGCRRALNDSESACSTSKSKTSCIRGASSVTISSGIFSWINYRWPTYVCRLTSP